MNDSDVFSGGRQRSGARLTTIGSLAVILTLVAILVASNLDLTTRSIAEVPTNIAQTGLFPVVDRNGSLESPFVSVVERAASGVVNISARIRDTGRPWWYYGNQYSTSLGSGFFFREDGYIVTNNHVVADAVDMTVRTSTGYEYEARLVGADPQTDLAVIKVEPEEEITVIPFGNSEEIKVGDWAIAIGNPFPQQGLDRTVTVGVVSAKGRHNLRFGSDTPEYQDYIQTDASINPGNSGGPLLTLKGEAMGVNAAISSPTGTSVGIGFAIPINLARAVVTDLIADGKASRGWLGVWLSDVTERDAKEHGLKAVRGVMIDSVFQGSPAERAGIKSGDIIVDFNRQEVTSAGQFSVLVSTVHEGHIVPVRVNRDGELLDLPTMVADRETFLAAMDERQDEAAGKAAQWLGMELIDYTTEVAAQIGAEHVTGVYVARVYAGTPAYRASIAEGTIIRKIDNQDVASVMDVHRLATEIGRNKSRIPMIVLEPDGMIARKVIRP
ncbi:MAG: trypsin-like peptidase domain-containing protein [candidate division Zixibacteria bacterium]|nr:trypsin-like peptidase domain-containing protein [candidate division Zixibacteria bacterium]